MITTARHIGATLLLAAGMLTTHEAAGHGAAGHAVVMPVLARQLRDIPGKDVMMMTVDYAPCNVDSVHSHAAHRLVYALEGSIEMGRKGGKVVTLNAGIAFHEGADDILTTGRSASKVGPASSWSC